MGFGFLAFCLREQQSNFVVYTCRGRCISQLNKAPSLLILIECYVHIGFSKISSIFDCTCIQDRIVIFERVCF